MGGRHPSNIGVMIRDALRNDQPLSGSEINEAVRLQRKALGMRRVTYKYVLRLVDEARRQGMILEREPKRKATTDRVEGYDQLNVARQFVLARGVIRDPRWIYLPKLARWKYEPDQRPPLPREVRTLAGIKPTPRVRAKKPRARPVVVKKPRKSRS